MGWVNWEIVFDYYEKSIALFLLSLFIYFIIMWVTKIYFRISERRLKNKSDDGLAKNENS